jgi:tetratricopeptide (TPR) repeat protein
MSTEFLLPDKKTNTIALNSYIKAIAVVIGLVLTISCSQNTKTVANRQTIDSLIVEIQDSLKTNIPYARKKIDTALKVVKNSVSRSELLNYRSYCFLMTDSLDTARLLIHEAINQYKEKPKDPHGYDVLAYSYNLNGIYFTFQDNYDSAFYYFQKAYQSACLGLDKKYIPDLCINLADAYFKKSDFSKAASYFRKALLYSDSLQITKQMGFPIYFGLGQVYLNSLKRTLIKELYRRNLSFVTIGAITITITNRTPRL